MKCGKCGKNEANYYYRETINGVSKEIRLCSECAEQEGLTQRFNRSFGFGPSFGFGRSFFEDFFSPFESFFGVPERVALGQRQEEKSAQQEAQSEAKQSAECDGELKARRERNILQQQLKEAVAREDYEKAIELRDQLKKMQ